MSEPTERYVPRPNTLTDDYRVWDTERARWVEWTWADATAKAGRLNILGSEPCCSCSARLERLSASHQRVLDLLAEISPGLMADLAEKMLYGIAGAQDILRSSHNAE